MLLFQFLVGVYGGYFGAGIGILMLAAFGFLGFTNIHHMNALKNLNAMCINGIAAVLFISRGLVDWRLALLMAGGAIFGGCGRRRHGTTPRPNDRPPHHHPHRLLAVDLALCALVPPPNGGRLAEIRSARENHGRHRSQRRPGRGRRVPAMTQDIAIRCPGLSERALHP